MWKFACFSKLKLNMVRIIHLFYKYFLCIEICNLFLLFQQLYFWLSCHQYNHLVFLIFLHTLLSSITLVCNSCWFCHSYSYHLPVTSLDYISLHLFFVSVSNSRIYFGWKIMCVSKNFFLILQGYVINVWLQFGIKCCHFHPALESTLKWLLLLTQTFSVALSNISFHMLTPLGWMNR